MSYKTITLMRITTINHSMAGYPGMVGYPGGVPTSPSDPSPERKSINIEQEMTIRQDSITGVTKVNDESCMIERCSCSPIHVRMSKEEVLSKLGWEL